MTAVVILGDAGNLQLPDESVDLVVTSPPYFGLRSYTDGGVHYAEQIGAEATPAEYLDALLACTAEWMRVLKPSGSIFVNLGDKYSGAQQQNSGKQSREESAAYWRKTNPKNTGIPAKSLMGFPWRYAIRCVDELGLILRSEIIWAKPNGLPESVTDRVRRSHEQVFHFTKAQRYYSAVDHIREHYTDSSQERAGYGFDRAMRGRAVGSPVDTREGATPGWQPSPLGKLPGSVWTIATSPLRVPTELEVDHFAAYPPELVRRIVLGWSPQDVCSACGEGRRPISERASVNLNPLAAQRAVARTTGTGGTARSTLGSMASETRRTITGFACACPDTSAESTPGVVLDPFGGTGTTALVASVLGRVGVSNDLSADYCRIARWRTEDPKQRAKVTGTAVKASKTPPQVEQLPEPEHVPGQLELDGVA